MNQQQRASDGGRAGYINRARTLTAEQLAFLAEVPPELEWLAGTLDRHLDPGAIYRNFLMKYPKKTGIAA